MTDFFRFPHTPHLSWFGESQPRDDKVLTAVEVTELLVGTVQVEEKLDGANIGISCGSDGELRVQNRGQYLIEPYSGQFSRLTSWLAQHQWTILETLRSDLILFGEWCAARHSLDYEALPDWLLVFDVYDKSAERFWSVPRRNELATVLGLARVPELFNGRTTLQELVALLRNATSRYRTGPPEGFIIRQDIGDWCQARAKLVRSEFTQTISEHWRSRAIQWNRVQRYEDGLD